MNQISDDKDLNSLLTNTPGNPLIWNRFLTELTKELNCDSSALLVTDLIERKNTHILFSANIAQEYQEQYLNEFNRLDTFNYFISKNPQHVFCNQTLEDAYIEEVESNFISPSDQKYRFGVSIPCNHKHSLSLLVNRKDAFNDEEQQRITLVLQTLLPSLEEAIHAE